VALLLMLLVLIGLVLALTGRATPLLPSGI
jgi:hypothetical protein